MKLSIITINYNDREGLARTLESVRRQTTRDFEYIVVDGGSSDGSSDLILESEGIITKWVSEPDKGIYNAMNKGVAMASGDYCLFLNSGDSLASPTSVETALNIPFNAPIMLSNVMNFETNGKGKLYVPPKDITFRRIIQTGIHHAGSFIQTNLMRKYPYREDLKILSDRDFFIKSIIFNNVAYGHIDNTICNFEYGGASSDVKLVEEERQKMLHSYFPPRFVEEYNKSDLQILALSEELVKCKHKVVKFICGLDKALLRLLRLLLGKKLNRKG